MAKGLEVYMGGTVSKGKFSLKNQFSDIYSKLKDNVMYTAEAHKKDSPLYDFTTDAPNQEKYIVTDQDKHKWFNVEGYVNSIIHRNASSVPNLYAAIQESEDLISGFKLVILNQIGTYIQGKLNDMSGGGRSSRDLMLSNLKEKFDTTLDDLMGYDITPKIEEYKN